MKIHLKRGIDKLRFGMSRKSVEKFIGKANREIIDPDDKNQLICEYSDQKLRLTFYQNEGGKLGYIRSSNPNLKIDEFSLIDCDIHSALEHIDSDSQSWEMEDYDSFRTYFHELFWLTLNVEYERVINIELGVPFKNDNEYDWPD